MAALELSNRSYLKEANPKLLLEKTLAQGYKHPGTQIPYVLQSATFMFLCTLKLHCCVDAQMHLPPSYKGLTQDCVQWVLTVNFHLGPPRNVLSDHAYPMPIMPSYAFLSKTGSLLGTCFKEWEQSSVSALKRV